MVCTYTFCDRVKNTGLKKVRGLKKEKRSSNSMKSNLDLRYKFTDQRSGCNDILCNKIKPVASEIEGRTRELKRVYHSSRGVSKENPARGRVIYTSVVDHPGQLSNFYRVYLISL